MGNSPSSQQRPSNPPSTSQFTYPSNIVQTGNFYPPRPPVPYPPSNGQFYVGYGPGHQQYPPQVPPGYQPPAHGNNFGQLPRQAQTQEYQKTETIRNQVNLKKQTLKLEVIPGRTADMHVTFSFDASAACRILAFFDAREEPKNGCKIHSSAPAIPMKMFDKGLNMKYPGDAPAASAVLSTAHLNSMAATSTRDGKGDAFPIIIRLEALTDEGRAEGRRLEDLEPGCELPRWVQSQTTYATVRVEDDGSWGIRVMKQKIWYKGNAYELQEIYGMEQGRTANVADGYDVEGFECVICMSAPRDTTALPCRHMCMCHGCASALKTQTNKCPICRNEITSLLHIKIAKGTPVAQGGGQPAAGASTST